MFTTRYDLGLQIKHEILYSIMVSVQFTERPKLLSIIMPKRDAVDALIFRSVLKIIAKSNCKRRHVWLSVRLFAIIWYIHYHITYVITFFVQKMMAADLPQSLYKLG